MNEKLPALDPSLLRKTILNLAKTGGTVHIACAFSIVETLAALYNHPQFSFNLTQSKNKDSDYFVLSKGHGVMALYAVYAQLGALPTEDLENYCQDGSRLHGLAEPEIPGIETAAGSLGHGFPVAVGIAYALKRKKDPRKVVCLVGDGELNEGTIWESLLFAGHHKLNNLLLIVDANEWQAMERIENVIRLEPLEDKFRSMHFYTKDIDGHDLKALRSSLDSFLKNASTGSQPTALIARTQKGKGVSFMEGRNDWHYMRLDDKKFNDAMKELES